MMTMTIIVTTTTTTTATKKKKSKIHPSRTHDIEVVLCQHTRSLVDGLARPVEHTPQHVLGNGRAQNIAAELANSIARINTTCALEHLLFSSRGENVFVHKNKGK